MVSQSTRAMFDAFHAELDARSAKPNAIQALDALIEVADNVQDEHCDDGDGYVSEWQSAKVSNAVAAAREAREAVADALDKARTLMHVVNNLVAAEQAPAAYLQYADDMRAALARCGGA